MLKTFICLDCKTFHVSDNPHFTCAECGGKTHGNTHPLNMELADNFNIETMPLPCPFCGDVDIEIIREGSYKASRIVRCGNCGCELETNEINSWKQWNTREKIK